MVEMSRICFVIMPFSTTLSCTEEEWTSLFGKVFKPAIEGAGLDYECRRSVATRGNIVAQILQELNDAYVVIADLTDRNANVFYELGVRHALKDRSILLAQKKEDIPFDLQAYAYHVYDWKTPEGQAALAAKLAQLLNDVDAKPQRSDNPVSDFLHKTIEPISAPPPIQITKEEVKYAQSLVGPSADGLDAANFARTLAHKGMAQAIKTVYRLTRTELLKTMRATVDSLNQRQVAAPLQQNQVPLEAQKYMAHAEPLIQKTEEFVLASTEESWLPGTHLAVRLAGDLVSLTEKQAGPTCMPFSMPKKTTTLTWQSFSW